MTIPMHYIWTGLTVWACLAGAAILFIRGATHPETRAQRKAEMEKA